MPDPSPRPAGLSRRGLAGAAVGALGAAAVVSATSEAAHAEQPFRAIARKGPRPRPNFLVILADDLGAADLSVYGSPDITTPHLDALAATGVRFTQGYSAGAVCSPTRNGSSPRRSHS